MTVHDALKDRLDLQGLVGVCTLVFVAAWSLDAADAAISAALQVAFVVFGYATVRAALAAQAGNQPISSDTGPNHDEDLVALRAPPLPPSPGSAPGVWRVGLVSDLYRRCAPALWLTILTTLVVTAVLRPPIDVQWTASMAMAASAFLANVATAFLEPASETALGHLWAVSLAGQWAVLAAGLGLLARAAGHGRLVWILLLLVALLSVGALLGLPAWASVLPTAWLPFAAGGLLVALDDIDWQHTLAAHLSREALLVIGAALVAGAVVMARPGQPGWAQDVCAVLPTIGAMAIVFARGAPTLGYVLVNPPLRILGAAGFTIYLVTWPISNLLMADMVPGPDLAAALVRTLACIAAGLALHVACRILGVWLGFTPGSGAVSSRPWMIALVAWIGLGCLVAALLQSDGSLLSGRPPLR